MCYQKTEKRGTFNVVFLSVNIVTTLTEVTDREGTNATLWLESSHKKNIIVQFVFFSLTSFTEEGVK